MKTAHHPVSSPSGATRNPVSKSLKRLRRRIELRTERRLRKFHRLATLEDELPQVIHRRD